MFRDKKDNKRNMNENNEDNNKIINLEGRNLKILKIEIILYQK